MDRLSRPLTDLRDHYTVVVVGSGYGGAILGSRMARAGQSVCILERGREIHPGQYPSTPLGDLLEIQAGTASGSYGSPTAMFDFLLDDEMSVLVGCGLGGTSLINANVALRAKEEAFEERWPAELRGNGRAVLEPYYHWAETLLGSARYPSDWPALRKLSALDRTAAKLGATAERAPINVTFRTGRNWAGVEQHHCVLCGDCVNGCNYWAKNTVLMNYLPDAHRHGAHIFTEARVRAVHRRPDGRWQVAFDRPGGGRDRFGGPTQFVSSDVVVLAAGCLGTTEILLRSREAGLPLSDHVGRHFSGNGDVLAFAYDLPERVRGVGLGGRPATRDRAVGPTITGTIDLVEEGSPDGGVLIEDGALPGSLAGFFPAAFLAVALAFGRDTRHGLRLVARRLAEAAGIPLGPYRGAADRTLTYLVMSKDNDRGRLVLQDDRLSVRWKYVGRQRVIRRDDHILARAAKALGGTFVPNPLWSKLFRRALITVHPLGGCVMADDAGTGVVNHAGQVFSGRDGAAVHGGLYVADGSVIPTPLGVNPLLTISALAERTCDLLAAERGWTFDRGAPEGASV